MAAASASRPSTDAAVITSAGGKSSGAMARMRPEAVSPNSASNGITVVDASHAETSDSDCAAFEPSMINGASTARYPATPNTVRRTDQRHNRPSAGTTGQL